MIGHHAEISQSCFYRANFDRVPFGSETGFLILRRLPRAAEHGDAMAFWGSGALTVGGLEELVA
jgi:hypothetical protein